MDKLSIFLEKYKNLIKRNIEHHKSAENRTPGRQKWLRDVQVKDYFIMEIILKNKNTLCKNSMKSSKQVNIKGPLFYNQINAILFPKKLLEIIFLLKGCAA